MEVTHHTIIVGITEVSDLDVPPNQISYSREMVDINPTVIAFNRNGPDNLGLSVIDESEDDLPLMPGSGVRVQRGDTYFTDDKFTAGIWECTPCQTVMGRYPVNEFMILLVGSVVLIDEKGNEMTFQAGEAFVIPKGMVVSWKQTEIVRKFYVMTLDESMVNGPSESLIAHRIIPGEGELFNIELYQDPSEQFTVGITKIIANAIEGHIPFPWNELLHVIDGQIIVTIGEVVHTFVTGDTFLVTKGARCKWGVDTELLGHAIYCSWDPKE